MIESIEIITNCLQKKDKNSSQIELLCSYLYLYGSSRKYCNTIKCKRLRITYPTLFPAHKSYLFYFILIWLFNYILYPLQPLIYWSSKTWWRVVLIKSAERLYRPKRGDGQSERGIEIWREWKDSSTRKMRQSGRLYTFLLW